MHAPYTHKNKHLFAFLLALGVCLFPHYVSAAERENRDVLKEAWEVPVIYENEAGPGIRSFALVGRYHGQYWAVNANQGEAEDWENRRVIFGFNSRISEQFSVEAQMHINDEFSDPVYDGLYVGFVKWASTTRDLNLSLGRLDYVFTGLERSTSSKKIYTFERGKLVNQLMPGEVFGLYGRGKNEHLSYQVGIFSGNIEDEFTDFSAGVAAVMGIGIKTSALYDKGTLHLDYLYNDGNEGNNAFQPYDHIVSLWHQGRKGAFNLGLDLTAASGIGDRSNAFGLTVLPTYDLTNNLLLNGDMLQAAFRYQYNTSKDDYGLVPQRRYEQEVTSGRGNQYQALYAGLNYLICGNKLKLMAGTEYSTMNDSATHSKPYRGWTYFAGLRLYF